MVYKRLLAISFLSLLQLQVFNQVFQWKTLVIKMMYVEERQYLFPGHNSATAGNILMVLSSIIGYVDLECHMQESQFWLYPLANYAISGLYLLTQSSFMQLMENLIFVAFPMFLGFWPGLGLPRPKAIVVIPKNQPLPKHLRKKTSKSAKHACHYATKKTR